MLPIDKDIPIPGIKPRDIKIALFAQVPWDDMQIGDSVLIKSRNCVGLKKLAKQKGVGVIIKVAETVKGGGNGHSDVPVAYRVWRVE